MALPDTPNESSVANLSFDERLRLTIKATMPKVAPEIAQQLEGLLEPGALAVAGGILLIWAGLHFTGAGEIADVGLLVIGYLALGAAAFQAGRELIEFAGGVRQAASQQDINRAADHLATAIGLIGVQGVLAMLLRARPKTFEVPEGVDPKSWNSWWRLRPAPVSPKGRWAYKPTVSKVDPGELDGALGVTSEWGDIEISSALSKEDARATLFHEEVHSFLSPKLYILRKFRAQVASQGYVKSVLLRYLEEAMAETRAALKVKGLMLDELLKSIRFPITSGGYEITVSRMRTEATGILLGPINVGGLTWNVWQSRRND